MVEVVRGFRITSRPGPESMDVEREATVLEARRNVTYDCSTGHQVVVPLHVKAEAPASWDCPTCGRTAARSDLVVDATEVAPDDDPLADEGPRDHEPVRPGAWYTVKHRREVYKRRGEAALEALLAERLAILRESRGEVPERKPA